MSPPGGLAAPASLNLRANGERQKEFLSPRVVAREAAKALAANGSEVRPAIIRHLVTRFIRDGHTTLAEIEPFVLDYLDPTGETAVSRVLKQRGH